MSSDQLAEQQDKSNLQIGLKRTSTIKPKVVNPLMMNSLKNLKSANKKLPTTGEGKSIMEMM